MRTICFLLNTAIKTLMSTCFFLWMFLEKVNADLKCLFKDLRRPRVGSPAVTLCSRAVRTASLSNRTKSNQTLSLLFLLLHWALIIRHFVSFDLTSEMYSLKKVSLIKLKNAPLNLCRGSFLSGRITLIAFRMQNTGWVKEAATICTQVSENVWSTWMWTLWS